MSYTTIDALLERAEQIDHAVLSSDVEALYAIADSYAEQDDMEQAYYFRNVARAIERAEWYHDNSIGN